jgi:hypothetical protein
MAFQAYYVGELEECLGAEKTDGLTGALGTFLKKAHFNTAVDGVSYFALAVIDGHVWAFASPSADELLAVVAELGATAAEILRATSLQ